MANKNKSEDMKVQAKDHVKTASRSRTKSTAKHKTQVHDKKPVNDKEREKLRESVKSFEAKNKELHDKYLRLSAEFDNYRKRTLREKTEMVKTASEDLLKKFIPFLDDIERGMQALNQVEEQKAIKEGMNLIYTRFRDFLQQNGIKEIEVLHQEFNMDLHEAVTKIPVNDEKLKGRIVDVIEKGYFLHDKVVRYPKVVIGE